MNSTNIIGRLTKDYETKDVAGKPIGNFTIAVNDGWGDKEHTSYYDVAVFGSSAERHAQYIGKGSKVGVTGSLRQERWQSGDGTKRSKIKIIANQIDYLDSKPVDKQEEDVPAF